MQKETSASELEVKHPFFALNKATIMDAWRIASLLTTDLNIHFFTKFAQTHVLSNTADHQYNKCVMCIYGSGLRGLYICNNIISPANTSV